MALLTKQFFFVLLVLVLFISLRVEAREGKFLFVSLHPSDHHKKSHENPSLLETPAPAPVAGGDFEFAPVPAAPEIGNGFAPTPAPSSGNYYEFAPTPLEGGAGFPPGPAPSRGDIEFPPTPLEGGNGYAPVPSPVTETFESDNPYGLYGENNEEFKNERFTEHNTVDPYNNNNGYVNNGYSKTAYNNDNNGYGNNYNGYSKTLDYNSNNNNGYSNNYNNNGHSSTAYNSMSYSNSNYNKGYSNNGYENEKQGMSDTRFLDNEKYYYNPHPESYDQNEGYESVRRSNNYEGYNGAKTKYEFDSMPKYERQQDYYP